MLLLVKKEDTPVAKDADALSRAMADAIDHLAWRANQKSIEAYGRIVSKAVKARTAIPPRKLRFDGAERAVSGMCDRAVFKVESLRDAAKVEWAVAQGMAESALGFVSAVRSGAFDSEAEMMEAAEESRRAMEVMAAEHEARRQAAV